MTTVTPARRRTYSQSGAAAKRRRVMTQTRIPKALMPELKQWVSAVALDATINDARMSIPSFMQQGNDGDQFLGSKFRITRVRVYFDYSDVTFTTGIRMALGIPKDPTDTTILSNVTGFSTVVPANMRQVTMLKEMFLKTDGSNLNGYMEWSGPLNIEMNEGGTAPLKNNLILQINSDGVGFSLQPSTRTRVEVLFTG